MAYAQRPFDITWDDVRKSRPTLRRKLLVGGGVLALVTFSALLWGLRTVAAPMPARVADPVALPDHPVQKAKSSGEAESFCGTLSRWSATTVLMLGPETRAYCDKTSIHALRR